jgi:transcriptional regulator with XRE-family HTH domain
MTKEEFRAWRQRFGLTQDHLAQRFGVTRNTIQNWESGASALPGTIDGACQVWEDRLRKELAEIGPVTLVYADGPMFIDPYGPRRRPAMLQQEAYPTNAAALARVQILWGTPGFQGPFIMQKTGEPLWNQVELMRVVDGSDQGAPTVRNTILKLAAYVRANAHLYVRNGPRTHTTKETEKNTRQIQKIADELEKLAHAGDPRVVEHREFEELLPKLHAFSFYPPNRLVGDVAHAIEGKRLALAYAA